MSDNGKPVKVSRKCAVCGLRFRVRKWSGDVKCPDCGCY